MSYIQWNDNNDWTEFLFHFGSHFWFSVPSLTHSNYFPTLQAYDLTQLISTFYFKSYNGLTKVQRIEWNNRWVSISFSSTCFPFQIVDYIFINLKSIFAAVSPPFMPSLSQLHHCILCSGQISFLTISLLALLRFEALHCQFLHWG